MFSGQMSRTQLLLLLLLLPLLAYAKPRTQRVCKHRVCKIYADPRDNTGQRVTHNVWIGNQYAAQNLDWLRSRRIDHIISLIGEPHTRLPSIRYRVYDLDDNGSQQMEAVIHDVHDYITRRIRGDHRVLVHCAVGVSRSATVVIGHMLLTHLDLSLRAATEKLRAVRPIIQPNDNFEHQLRALEKKRTKKHKKFILFE